MTTQVQADMAVNALTDEELEAANGGVSMIPVVVPFVIDVLVYLAKKTVGASSDSSKHMASTTSSSMAGLSQHKLNLSLNSE